MNEEAENIITTSTGYFELGMLDEAVQELRRLGNRERVNVLWLWCTALRLAGRWTDMREVCRRIVSLDPSEAENWIGLADAVRHAESLAAGLKVLAEADTLFPEDGHVAFQIGCYKCQLGQFDEARQQVRRAVSLNKIWGKIALHDRDLEPLWGEFRSGKFSDLP